MPERIYLLRKENGLPVGKQKKSPRDAIEIIFHAQTVLRREDLPLETRKAIDRIIDGYEDQAFPEQKSTSPTPSLKQPISFAEAKERIMQKRMQRQESAK